LKEVHIVVYTPDGRPPQLDPERVESEMEHLVTLYRGASR